MSLARMQRRSIVDAVAIVLTIIVATVVVRAFWPGPVGPEPPTDSTGSTFALDGYVRLGSSPVRRVGSPRIALIVFSDFECQFCARLFRDILPTVTRDYVDTGRVALAYKHLPIARHARAEAAAAASECANRQGRFWPMAGAFFENPARLSDDDFRRVAAAAGLNAVAFTDCLTGEGRESVRNDIEAAKGLGIRGTPTMLIGTLDSGEIVHVRRAIRGSQGHETIAEELNRALGASGG